MIRELVLDSVGWDTRLVEPRAIATFFGDSAPGAYVSGTGLEEHAIVEVLLTTPATNQLLSRVMGLGTPVVWATRARQPFVEPGMKPGDVDALWACRDCPQQAVAVEAKRVKIRADGDGGQRINKLEAAHGATDQVAGLVSLGFSRTYLMLIAVVDDRSDPGLNFAFRGASTSSLRRVVQFADEVSLPEESGLLYVEVSQPLARDLESAGFVAAGVLRPARPRDQSADLTTKIANYLSANGRAV